MRVLVTAASKHGATAEIARLIAGRLADAGLDVTLLPPDQVEKVDGFDAVVIGSAVYVGRWMDDAKRFINRFGPDLASRPVWLFSSGPAGDPPKPEGEPADVPAIREATHARYHRVFDGRIDRSHLGFGEKLAVTAVHAPDGDFRPLGEITRWADEIARALGEPAAAPA